MMKSSSRELQCRCISVVLVTCGDYEQVACGYLFLTNDDDCKNNNYKANRIKMTMLTTTRTATTPTIKTTQTIEYTCRSTVTQIQCGIFFNKDKN